MGETDTTEPTVILSQNQPPPALWRFPVCMPFAWEIVAVQLGYVGLWLWQRFNGWGLATVGILGALNLPLYEEIARRINWWAYRNCRMISYTPYYIILANSDRHPAGDPGQAAHPRQLDNRTTSVVFHK